MPARNLIKRILKFLGKVALGLLILLISFILIVHIPSVQNRIAHRLIYKLSIAMKARIELQNIKFSLLGDVEMQGLQVWDPDSNLVFTVGKMGVKSNIFDIVTGDYLFEELRLEDVKGQLIQNKDGLNIHFILAAFEPKDKLNITPDTTLKNFKFHFKRIILQNIAIDFISTVSGTNMSALLGNASSENAEYSTHNNMISADEFCFGQLDLNILTHDQEDTLNAPITLTTENVFIPDFGVGLGLDIKDFEITNSHFAFHRDTMRITKYFDPNHIDLRDIQVNLSDVVMHPDTLSGSLQTISAQLSGFSIIQASGEVKMNRSQLALSSFHISSDTNDLKADLIALYNPLATHPEVPDVTFIAEAKVNPAGLSYFLNEKMRKNFNHWKTTELSIDGNYVDGKGNLKKLNINTSNSQLMATGKLEDILSAENISWNNLVINASVGPDFKSLLAPYLGDMKIPPSIKVQMNSSGNPNRIFIDGKVLTTWGDVKAKGTATPMGKTIGIDLNLSGQQVSLGEMLDMPWLGPVSMTANAKGKLGARQDAQINGSVSSIVIMNQSLYDIAFQSRVINDSVNANISIADPRYPSKIQTAISFAEPLVINANAHLTDFKAGTLFQMDSSLSISGDLITSITIDPTSIKGTVYGDSLFIHNQYADYAIDTLTLAALTSHDSSYVNYLMDDGKGTLISNFDLRDFPGILKSWSTNLENFPRSNTQTGLNRTLQFNFDIDQADPFKLLGFEIDDFSSLKFAGDWNEQQQSFVLKANSGAYKGYGISMDTLYANISILRDSATAVLNANNLFFNHYELGHLDFDLSTTGDTAVSNLLLSHDSISLLGWKARVLRNEGGIYIFPDKLLALQKEYAVEGNKPILIKEGNASFDEFKMSRDNMQLSLNGDVHAFEASFNNLDLTLLNSFLFPDSAVINKGSLTGTFTYASNQQLNLKANVDSLELYHSVPLTISMTAVKNGDQVPFEFLLSNATTAASLNTRNHIDAHGKYFLNDESVDASLLLDVNNPEMFAFLYADYLDHLKGAIKGHATILGPVKNPELKGTIRFRDLSMTTTKPKLTFTIKDDSIQLNNNGLTLDQFKIFDRQMHPLTITGNMTLKDLPAYKYQFNIAADDYALIDNADTVKGPLKGLLVVDSDITLSGNEKDTHVKADVTIKDNTNLKYTLATEDDAVLNTIGIVEFVDPGQLTDTLHLATTENAYDSIVASLPDFNLNAKIRIEENAKLKVITNEESGDYFEAAGGANLELSQDRTGNLQLAGTYTIKKGVYRISFYDLVKKSFDLVPGSAINWSGSPESGEMDIRAVYAVATNSIGLVGHEIGENEKNIYKRTLEYTVGINIKGTLEQPIISFTLDLPEEDRASYPVLANKLDRLKLPEFQTELNKQVFGLLVLGGFLPETSVAEIDQSQIATTAIYNSVNALLASQLNRFASQYIKGVNIDVGIQSYADYSTPGGKTQTAMDFRVSKSVFNDRLSFEVGGDFNLNADQSGGNSGDNYRGDVAIIYDLTGNGDKQLKLFNNESYDIIYQEIRNTGISLIFVREFNKGDKKAEKAEGQKGKRKKE